MNFHDKVSEILNRQRYAEDEATLLAHDVPDGRDPDRGNSSTFLFRAVSGDFFTVTIEKDTSEQETEKPITRVEAVTLYYGRLNNREVEFLDAFPGIGF